jgi:hypothetical protein
LANVLYFDFPIHFAPGDHSFLLKAKAGAFTGQKLTSSSGPLLVDGPVNRKFELNSIEPLKFKYDIPLDNTKIPEQPRDKWEQEIVHLKELAELEPDCKCMYFLDRCFSGSFIVSRKMPV